MTTALVIGAGPAGLMAAQVLAEGGARVTVADRMPSPARKFLMAGKSGLNLTKDAPGAAFLSAYPDPPAALRAALDAFGPAEVIAFAEALGQEVFTGSSGRVFPKAMKASPLLRAWLARLADLGVELRSRWAWRGWDGDASVFDTPGGPETLRADVTILAVGGASWPRLGSDGAWSGWVGDVAPYAPANAGLRVAWSDHMTRHFGAPLKGIALRAGGLASRGEVVLTASGIEGGGIYTLTPPLRDGAPLTIDLMPDLTVEALRERLARPGPKTSQTNRLRKAGLTPVKVALVQEYAREAPDLAAAIKALPIPHQGTMGLERAISSAGGLRFEALDEGLMIRARPGIFACGEMLDWEAPTGGYLLTACFATGRHAARAALRYAE
ncbi:MAG: aminoacetone oxidase family FAD-binding enzyme [Rhodobacterales bacterium]|nr:MAG: aminoacetone oxidase family FAD-binding enzyme [Rhodobacterales bacterium]